jgi:Anticodon binding domain
MSLEKSSCHPTTTETPGGTIVFRRCTSRKRQLADSGPRMNADAIGQAASERHHAYAEELQERLQKAGLRVEVDGRNEGMGAKSATLPCRSYRTSWWSATRRQSRTL